MMLDDDGGQMLLYDHGDGSHVLLMQVYMRCKRRRGQVGAAVCQYAGCRAHNVVS